MLNLQPHLFEIFESTNIHFFEISCKYFRKKRLLQQVFLGIIKLICQPLNSFNYFDDRSRSILSLEPNRQTTRVISSNESSEISV